VKALPQAEAEGGQIQKRSAGAARPDEATGGAQHKTLNACRNRRVLQFIQPDREQAHSGVDRGCACLNCSQPWSHSP
jgi:hypothetical protein